MELNARYISPVVKIVAVMCLWWFFPAMAAAQPASTEKDKLRLGFSTNLFIGVDKRDVQVALDIWVKELGRSLSISQEPVAMVFSDLNETAESVRKQEVDFVAMSFLDYLKIRAKVDLEPILVGTKNGQVGEKYALVIHRSAPWTDMKQLRNKKLLVQESTGTSAISLLWLDNILYQQKLPESANFFQPLRIVDKPSKAVLPIFFQQADVCLVPLWVYDTMVELNPQVGSETKILVTSPILPKGAFFKRKGVSPRKQAIIEDAIRMVDTEKSKQLLTLFNSEKFTRYQPQFLQTVIDLENSNLSFKKNNK